MILTLLLTLLVLLEPWGLRGGGAGGGAGGGPWGRALGAVVPPSWADPRHNPCASQPGGWQLLLWPADGRCYRIFRRGHPCPPSMELTPGVGPGGAPGCRCPPGTAHLQGHLQAHLQAHLQGAAAPATKQCYPLLEQGPCPHGQYLAPLPPPAASQDRVPDLRAACRSPEPCPAGHVFWARDGRCYPRLTRGPCYRGELLVAANASAGTGTPLGACRCEPRGELARYYSPLTKTCHEHYTPGPCQEKGLLFLPAPAGTGAGGQWGQCGCSADLPHYHPASKQCYQIDTIGPCPAGHRFSTQDQGVRAQCRCKGGHVPWPRPPPPLPTAAASTQASACYRPWTRGPCPAGQLLSDESECVAAPCRPGRLYFPEEKGCYKVGVRGPCPKAQVVLFETAVRPALEGISYRGMCGCTGPNAASRSSSNDIAGRAIEDNRCGPPADKDAEGVKRSAAAAMVRTESRTETRTESETVPRTEVKTVPRTEVKTAPRTEVKTVPRTEVKTVPRTEAKTVPRTESEIVPRTASRTEVKTVPRTERDCESKSGAIVYNGTCHSLYTQGPCPLGQWLVPQRRGREGRTEPALWSAPGSRPRARCDCRPGYKAVLSPGPTNTTALLECQPPTVVLASFLNSRGFAVM